jgi:hypothetical protein
VRAAAGDQKNGGHQQNDYRKSSHDMNSIFMFDAGQQIGAVCG